MKSGLQVNVVENGEKMREDEMQGRIEDPEWWRAQYLTEGGKADVTSVVWGSSSRRHLVNGWG
jgi:hypothetical protein